MLLSPHITAFLRFLFVSVLTVGNCVALWKVIQKPKSRRRCHVNRLSLIGIILVNLFYISFVWAPFTVSAFSYYITGSPETSVIHNPELPASTRVQRPFPYQVLNGSSSLESLQRTKRWAKVESQSHEGSWSLVFPVRKIELEGGDQTRFPSYICIDCMLQDVVTSAAIYSLAFITVIKLILTKRPIVVSTSVLANAGYIFLMTGIPILTTFAIRYGEQLGANFSPHNPDKTTGGYTLYNIICDVHIDDIFVFLSFLEWAGLILVLLLTVTSFLGLSTRAEDDLYYFADVAEAQSSTDLERLSTKIGRWVRDSTLFLATLWAWPLKPTSILVLYVMSGRHWTNTVSWMSHVIMAISTVFQPLSTFMSNDLYNNDRDTTISDNKRSSGKRKGENRRESHVIVLPPNLSLSIDNESEFYTDLHLPTSTTDHSPPSYQEDAEQNKSRYIQNLLQVHGGKAQNSLRSAENIRNNLEKTCEVSSDSTGIGEAGRIVLEDGDHVNTSDV